MRKIKTFKKFKTFEEAPPFDMHMADTILGDSWTEEETEKLHALGADEIKGKEATFKEDGYTMVFLKHQKSNFSLKIKTDEAEKETDTAFESIDDLIRYAKMIKSSPSNLNWFMNRDRF